MPKKTTHQRRVELGIWLEELLNPKINKWEIYRIINDAIKLLDFDFPLDKQDYFFQLVENLQQSQSLPFDQAIHRRYEELMNFISSLDDIVSVQGEIFRESLEFPGVEEVDRLEAIAIEFQKQINWNELPQIVFHENLPTGEDDDRIGYLKTFSFSQTKITNKLFKKFRSQYNLPTPNFTFDAIEPPLKKHLESEEEVLSRARKRKLFEEEVLNNPKLTSLDKRIIPYVRLHRPIKNVLDFFDQREIVLIILKKIKERDRPWKLSLTSFFKKPDDIRKLPRDEYNGDRYRFDPSDLILAYNKLSEHLHIKDNFLTLERTLLQGYFQTEVNSKEEKTTYSDLPTDVFISNIFFDFLLLGGQDYYGFCEYCDSFFVIERKNRKKFCSDVCRTLNQRK